MQAFLRDQTTSRDDHIEEHDFAATFVELEEDEDMLAFNIQVARKAEQDREVCAQIEDEPMAQLCEIQKRKREENPAEPSATSPPSIWRRDVQKKEATWLVPCRATLLDDPPFIAPIVCWGGWPCRTDTLPARKRRGGRDGGVAGDRA